MLILHANPPGTLPKRTTPVRTAQQQRRPGDLANAAQTIVRDALGSADHGTLAAGPGYGLHR